MAAEQAELERQRKEQARAEEKARKDAERERKKKEAEDAKKARMFADMPDSDDEKPVQQQ